MQFEEFALHAQIMSGVRNAGYSTATPIQAQAIPMILSGRDCIGLAQTGTGKTAAFLLPILHRMLQAGARKEGPVRTLVLAPTRELALQIHHEVMTLGRSAGYRSAPVIGGVGQYGQVKALRRAAICVACPGRLLDLMQQGVADLSHVDVLVLDEADTMLDMGFLPAIKQVLSRLPKKMRQDGSPARQTLLFSATMPQQIRALAEGLMHDPQTVQVANTAPAHSVAHSVFPISQDDKGDALDNLLQGAMRQEEGKGSVIVFTRTKHRAKALALKLAKQGLAVVALQGNMSQNKRQAAMDGFKTGKYRVLVATDIAARGIDCRSVSHVINYDPPDTAEAYTHRIGRTGRANRTGVAITLMAPGERRIMKDIERALGCQIDRYLGPDGEEVTVCVPEPALLAKDGHAQRDAQESQRQSHRDSSKDEQRATKPQRRNGECSAPGRGAGRGAQHRNVNAGYSQHNRAEDRHGDSDRATAVSDDRRPRQESRRDEAPRQGKSHAQQANRSGDRNQNRNEYQRKEARKSGQRPRQHYQREPSPAA